MNEPRVDPDYDPSEEVLEKAALLLAKAQARMLVGSYHERPNGGGKLLNWLLGIISALLIIGIVGQVVMYGDVRELKSQVARVEKIVDIRFRGGDENFDALQGETK